MKLYKDIFTEKEVFTDAYKIELVDDIYYAIQGKYIVHNTSISDKLIGGNKSAEDDGVDDGQLEEGEQLVADILSGCKLEEAPSVSSKKQYKEAIKVYIKKLVNHITKKDADRGEFLKANLMEKFVMPMLKKFSNITVYGCDGDEFDLEGGMILYELENPDAAAKVGTKFTIYVLKDSVIEEKL